MVRAIVLIVVFLLLLTTTAQYQDFRSLMALVGVFAVVFVADWVTKRERG
jgi:hypothetical protein